MDSSYWKLVSRRKFIWTGPCERATEDNIEKLDLAYAVLRG